MFCLSVEILNSDSLLNYQQSVFQSLNISVTSADYMVIFKHKPTTKWLEVIFKLVKVRGQDLLFYSFLSLTNAAQQRPVQGKHLN